MVLLEHPAIGFAAREPAAVDPRLLAGAETDYLSLGGYADRVGLRIAERDRGDQKVAANIVGELGQLGDGIGED